MEIKMNIFHRKNASYPDNGNGQSRLEQYEINGDWQENYIVVEKTEISAKKSYYPNAILFRRLIEDTSFDRRKSKIEEAEIPNKSDSLKPINNNAQPNLSAVKIPPIKKLEKKANFYKPLKKKNFISKEEQDRLQDVINRIFNQKKKTKYNSFI